MEYILSETLKRHKNSLTKIILVAFISVIILNMLITLTNTVKIYKNLLCIVLLLVFCVIMYFFMKRMMYVYTYNLGDELINFKKEELRGAKDILTVNFKDIQIIDKYENIYINNRVQKTYYFLYGFNNSDCYYCEYETNNKINRFVFKPSERLIRILERKIGNKNYEHGKD